MVKRCWQTEIQEAVLNTQEEEEEEEEEDVVKPQGPTIEEVVQMTDSLITWLQHSSTTNMDPIHVLHVKAIKRLAMIKANATKQQDIRTLFSNTPTHAKLPDPISFCDTIETHL